MKATNAIFASIALFCLTWLHADDKTLWRNIATESDWSATLDRVNVISGQYVESRKDPICLGKEPLFFHAFFSSFLCKERQGGKWDIMPHLVLTKTYDNNGDHPVMKVKDSNGTQFVFSNGEKTLLSQAIMLNQAIEGTSNTARGDISSKTNVINTGLSWDRNVGEFTLYLPNSARRIYRKTNAHMYTQGKKNLEVYLLHKEIKENGYVIFYEYTAPGRLYKMQTFSPIGRLYNFVVFHYRDDSPSVAIENSYGGKHHPIHYRFIPYKRCNPAHPHFGNRNLFFLDEIINPYGLKEVNYYGKANENNPLQVTSKQFGENATTHFEYEINPDLNSHGKVKHIFATLPDQHQKGKTHSLYYNTSYTEVRDSEGRKDSYHFDSNHRLNYIERFSKENGADILQSEERFTWSVNRHDQGMIHHGLHKIGDGMNVLSSKKLLVGYKRSLHLEERFQYNDMGEILKLEQIGNFTGTGRLDTLTTCREYQLTPVSDRFRTSQLSKETHPDGTFHTYQYLGSTPLLTSEFLHDSSGNILTRKFWRYSNENNVILTVEDDGNSADIDDVSSVNVRKIHRFILSDQNGCFGLSEVIFEEFYEPKTGQICQLSKTVNQYNYFAQIIQQDIYNSNDTHLYSLYFKYDARGNVTYSKDQMGQEIYSEYNDLGLKTREKHVQKNLLCNMQYDDKGRLIGKTEQRDGKNYATSYTYDINSRKQSETDPFGHTTYYEYDSRSNISAITGPLSFNADGSAAQPRVELSYDHLSRLKERREGEDSESFEYNVLGKMTLHKDRNGAITRTIYHYNQAIDYQILHDGSKIYYVYDALKRPLKKIKISPSGEELAKEQWVYQGLLLKEKIDEEGIATHFSYDGAGRLLSQATGTSLTCYTYDSLGQIDSEKTYTDDSSYIETTKKYDLANQLIETKTTVNKAGTSRLIGHKEFDYDVFGHLSDMATYTTEREAVEENTKYDSQGRVILFSDREGKETNITYDDYFADPYYNAHPTNTREYALYRFWESEEEIIPKMPRGNRRALMEWQARRRDPEYKAKARHILETYYAPHKLMPFKVPSLESVPKGAVLKKTTTLPSGKIVEEIYNAWGLLSQMCKKGADGKEVAKEEWVYDDLKRKIKQISTIFYKGEKVGKSETTWQYDAKGNVIALLESSHLPDPKITKMSYTFDALLEKVVKPSQVELFYTYDLLRHLKELKSSDGSVHYRYSYDKKGRLLSSQDLLLKRSQKIAYNENDNPIEEELLPHITIKRSYNRASQKTRLTLPNGETIHYRYEGPHVKEVAFRKYRHTCHRYDLSGSLLEEELMSGQRTCYQYDDMFRRIQLTHPHFTHEIKAIDDDDLVTHSWQTHKGATYETTYSYDSLCQLERERGPMGHSYEFDSHEVLRKLDDSPLSSNEKHQIEKLKETPFTYDTNGNRRQKGKWSYQYDALDRLTRMQKEGLKLSFTYDACHRRLTKTVEKEGAPPLTTLYLYDGDAEIGSIVNKELQELRILKDTSFAEIGSSILILLNDVPYIPLHDLFGNLSALLPLEDSEGSHDHTLYSAFGEELTLNKKRKATEPLSPWTFQSKRKEVESQLIYFGRRFYDPETCSFINPDPKELGTIPNPYTYVHNNPLLHHDLYGLEPDSAALEDTTSNAAPLTRSLIKTNPIIVGPNFTPPLNRTQSYQVGSIDLAHGGIGCINGIGTSFKEARDFALKLSEYGGGIKIDGVYNTSYGFGSDLLKCGVGYAGVHTNSVPLLKENWNNFDATHSPDKKYMQVAISGGAIFTRIALESSPEHIRNRIIFVGISPAEIIPDTLCYRAYNYSSTRDFVPHIGLMRKPQYRDQITWLTPDPDAPFLDHGSRSPTFKKPISDHIDEYIKKYGN